MIRVPHQHQREAETARGIRVGMSRLAVGAHQFQFPEDLPGDTCRGDDAFLPALHRTQRPLLLPRVRRRLARSSLGASRHCNSVRALCPQAGAVSASQGCSRVPSFNLIRKLSKRSCQGVLQQLHPSVLSSSAGFDDQQPNERLCRNVGNVFQEGPH